VPPPICIAPTARRPRGRCDALDAHAVEQRVEHPPGNATVGDDTAGSCRSAIRGNLTSASRSICAAALTGGSGTVPAKVPKQRRLNHHWSEDEERLLVEGYTRYGPRWELIRDHCKLSHLDGTQLRSKYRTLARAGAIH